MLIVERNFVGYLYTWYDYDSHLADVLKLTSSDFVFAGMTDKTFFRDNLFCLLLYCWFIWYIVCFRKIFLPATRRKRWCIGRIIVSFWAILAGLMTDLLVLTASIYPFLFTASRPATPSFTVLWQTYGWHKSKLGSEEQG